MALGLSVLDAWAISCNLRRIFLLRLDGDVEEEEDGQQQRDDTDAVEPSPRRRSRYTAPAGRRSDAQDEVDRERYSNSASNMIAPPAHR